MLVYDYLILATGSTHSYFGRDDWAKLAPGLKTVEDATEIRRRVLLAFELAEREMMEKGTHPALNFVVLPWESTTFDTPTTIVQGTGDQENQDRYGEYAATVVDSTDGLTFYGVGQYYDTNQTGTANCTKPASACYTWQTRIFRGKYNNPF